MGESRKLDFHLGPCKHFDPHNDPVGIYYCDKDDTICLFWPFKEDSEKLKEKITEIISHETLHWVLLKEVSEEACSYLDVLTGDGTLFNSKKK